MGSLGNVVESEGNKAMWLFPKLVTSIPSQRWGHSSCFFQGHLYVFGGCCGGMHFSDVLTLNLETVTWTTLITLGNGPGPRDSHSATIWGQRVIVFGGTNGSKKVNDLHILDLGTKQWVHPTCSGTPPSPRESHTATLLEGEMLAVFGGSGEGAGNYLNDLHILDLKTMSWTSPKVQGQIPPPRDSHISIAVGRRIFFYGGDCGDRYHGDVDVLDTETWTWSMMEVHGSSPGRRAGHSAVRIGTKMYIISGVGDKKYYNDSWMFDTTSSLWSKLEIRGQLPQGRFSHTAIVTDSDIVIYGGCGEDERPLGELLILQLGDEHLSDNYNISLCKPLGSHWNQGRRKGLLRVKNGMKTMLLGSCIETERKHPQELEHSDSKKLKRSVKVNEREKELEQDEHSLSVSQNSSPSQSDQEQPTLPNPSVSKSLHYPKFNHLNKSTGHPQSINKCSQQNLPDMYIVGEHRSEIRPGRLFPSSHMARSETELLTAEARPMSHNSNQNLLGADVQGKVDGAFDSGYLMTATVNGRIFRGVLFAPGPNMMSREANRSQSECGRVPLPQSCTNFDRASMYGNNPTVQPVKSPGLRWNTSPRRELSPVVQAGALREQELRNRSDLQGVVLTLGGPASIPK